MSLIQKTVVFALVVAASQFAAPEAKADPFSKLFAKAGQKVVGGISQSVGKNVTQSSKLILKAAPYALLQGSSSGRSRSNGSSSFQNSGFQSVGQVIQGNVMNTNRTGTWQNARPIYYGSQYRR